MAPPAPYRVLFPTGILDRREAGLLFGYFHEDSRVFNVISCSEPPLFLPQATALLGSIGDNPVNPAGLGLEGRYTTDGVSIVFAGHNCDVEFYSTAHDVFSRNIGILETTVLADQTAIISGCGSVGSLVALEFARAGVGRFLLVDPDRLEYHNLSRHQCGTGDVGRWKVDAVRGRILDINRLANVMVAASPLERLSQNVFDDIAIGTDGRGVIVGCADNRQADLYGNRLSQLFRVPFVSIGLWERAFAGEVFWSVPAETPCYYCVFGEHTSNLSFRESVNRRHYTTEPDVSDIDFEPGISVDISFVTSVGIKVALDLMSRGRPQRVLGDLTQFTLVCNSPHGDVKGGLNELFEHSLQITRSIEIERLNGCPHCGLAKHS